MAILNIGAVYRAEIYTDPRPARCVGHRRVQLRARENHDAPNGRDRPDLWIELNLLLRLGLRPGVLAYLLRGGGSAVSVPLVVVITLAAILHCSGEVVGVERHGVFG